MLDNALKNIRS